MITRAHPAARATALVSLLAAAGCGLLSFDVDEDIPAQTINGSPLAAVLPAGLFTIPINIDLSAATASRGTGPAKSAKLKTLTLTITSPAGGTFDFLDSISITVSSTGLADAEIARAAPVPAQNTISIPPVGNVDLLPYIKAGATIKATASGHLPSQDTTFDGKVTITVDV